MIISKFVPRRIASLIKSKDLLRLYSEKIKQIKKRPDSYVYLFGTPNHANMGDHLIAVSEIQYLQDEFGMNVMDVPTEMYHIYRGTLKKIIPKSCLIFITGGGWMGDVWPIEERSLENIAFDFRSNPTLVFPQTIFYLNPETPNKVSKRAVKIFKKCTNLVICVRDQESFNYATRFYDNELVLCPDIALYYQTDLPIKTNIRKKIGICFREDREKINHARPDEIMKEFQNDNVEFIKLSTIADSAVSCEERKERVDCLIEKFHKCDLVITDRLHGMIYSFLAKSPCMAFDNRTHKISGVYALWLNDCTYIEMMNQENDLKEVVKVGRKLLDIKIYEKTNTSTRFENIYEVIASWLR